MKDAIVDENITVDNARAVHEDSAFGGDGNVEERALERRHAGVAKECAVHDCAGNDVVLQDIDKLASGKAWDGARDSLESGVVRREDGDVGTSIKSANEVSLSGCARESSEPCFEQSVRRAERDGEDRVDDMDDAVIELDVSCRNRTDGFQTRSHDGVAFCIEADRGDLATADVGAQVALGEEWDL